MIRGELIEMKEDKIKEGKMQVNEKIVRKR